MRLPEAGGGRAANRHPRIMLICIHNIPKTWLIYPLLGKRTGSPQPYSPVSSTPGGGGPPRPTASAARNLPGLQRPHPRTPIAFLSPLNLQRPDGSGFAARPPSTARF
ncbi:hypothetical protein CORC01_11760 [Colletotrichum orchidophilum]|uniref:Uncharacterized protein n=1 Tax=Colletotrichum orchidophilum TaxID=1209926 RepID=A0A1G4AUX4_9PEZI|nr:uncharacterized protein CORC01_11760 [Colletotrichum orchidophilum]OHE92967.1 hypothetical protein CORC01_11760 [Colletotrichum orchidophilum]